MKQPKGKSELRELPTYITADSLIDDLIEGRLFTFDEEQIIYQGHDEHGNPIKQSFLDHSLVIHETKDRHGKDLEHPHYYCCHYHNDYGDGTLPTFNTEPYVSKLRPLNPPELDYVLRLAYMELQRQEQELHERKQEVWKLAKQNIGI